MLRSILAVIVGSVLATVLIMGVQMIGHIFFPPPTDYASNPEVLDEYIQSAPPLALACPLISYLIGAFCGGWLAAFLSTCRKMMVALMVGIILLALGIWNLAMVPHPAWFTVLTVVIFLPAAYGGARMAIGKKVSE